MDALGPQRRCLLFLSTVFLLFIMTPDFSRAQGPPIFTDTPIMLGLEGRGVRTFLQVVRRDGLLQDGEQIPDSLDQSVTTYLYPLIVPVNLRTTTQLGAVVPFLTREVESTAGSMTESGLGDVTIFLKQLLVQVDRKAETFRLAAKASAKLPTGDEDADVPLGSGSFDYGLSAVGGWIKQRWGLYGEAIYFVNTSKGDTDFGNRFGYNAAVGLRLIPTVYEHYPSPQLNLYLELNGNVVQKTEVDDQANPNSGGSRLFVSPGIQYVGGRRWLLEASVQLPIVDEPNGTQLATDWTARIGTRVLIF